MDSLWRENLMEYLKKLERVAGLDEILPEVWKNRKFDNIVLQLGNIIYKQNTMEKWTKSCILPFYKKRYLKITMNYRGMTLLLLLRFVMACFSIVSNPKLRKYLEKIGMILEIAPQPLQILTIHQIITSKQSWGSTSVHRFL